jgi:hypothetical protein
VKAAVRLLEKNKGLDAAWQILSAAAKSTDAEILTSLLGVNIGGYGRLGRHSFTGVVTKPRMLSHLDSMSAITIPNAHQAKYLDLVLSNLMQSKDEDIRVLAMIAYAEFLPRIEKDRSDEYRKQAVANWSSFIKEYTQEKYLINAKQDVQQIYNTRFERFWEILTRAVGLHTAKVDANNLETLRKYVWDLVDHFIATFLSLSSSPCDYRTEFLHRLEIMFRFPCQPTSPLTSYGWEVEQVIREKFGKLGVAWHAHLLSRRVSFLTSSQTIPERTTTSADWKGGEYVEKPDEFSDRCTALIQVRSRSLSCLVFSFPLCSSLLFCFVLVPSLSLSSPFVLLLGPDLSLLFLFYRSFWLPLSFIPT